MDFADDKKRKLDGNGGVTLSKDEIRQLLNPLTREQQMELLVEAAERYPGVADDIRDLASKDPAHRKLFVRGLSWETTSQSLRDAFLEFGEIEEGAVVMDKTTGKSRGFGFITFKTMDGAYRALKEPSKKIDGRMTVCNLAATGPTHAQGATAVTSQDISQRKIYIGSLDYNTTTETLLALFGQHGEIEEGSVAYDKATGKSRGFAFVTFKTSECARKALQSCDKNIDGRPVIVKLAIEGAKQKEQQQQQQQQQVQQQQAAMATAAQLGQFAMPGMSFPGTYSQARPAAPTIQAYNNPAALYSTPAGLGGAYATLTASGAQYTTPTYALPQQQAVTAYTPASATFTQTVQPQSYTTPNYAQYASQFTNPGQAPTQALVSSAGLSGSTPAGGTAGLPGLPASLAGLAGYPGYNPAG